MRKSVWFDFCVTATTVVTSGNGSKIAYIQHSGTVKSNVRNSTKFQQYSFIFANINHYELIVLPDKVRRVASAQTLI